LKVWTAPEVLGSNFLENFTKPSDVYSFAIIVQEIFTREDPFTEVTDMEPKDILRAVLEKHLRPVVPNNAPQALHKILDRAWHHDPSKRPPFTEIMKKLKSANPNKQSVLDCMMETVEQYVHNLEEKVQERTIELDAAMKNLESLLHKILPPAIADKLSRGEPINPETYECVTIYFSDICGFTSLSSQSSPMQVVAMLNELYTVFDAVIDNHDVYKVETIGDAYMVISGLPNLNGDQHAGEISNMALDLAIAVTKFKGKEK
jgi:serine/threonine protein kinase